MRIRSLIVAGILVAVPSLASAIPVLRPGELSVGAEILPNEHVTGDFLVPSDRGASPGAGFNVRYSFDDQVAVIGSIGLAMTTIGDDPEYFERVAKLAERKMQLSSGSGGGGADQTN